MNDDTVIKTLLYADKQVFISGYKDYLQSTLYTT
jgi:hypothetical protein